MTLVYTDGGDNRNSLELSEVLDFLKASGVAVCAIVALEGHSTNAHSGVRMVLQEITEATGGLAFSPADEKEVDKVYKRVLSKIVSHYTLGYFPTDRRANGAWRKVEIKLRAPNARRVRARKGYDAPSVRW